LHPWVVHRVLRKSAIGFPKPYFKLEENKISLKSISRLNQLKQFRKLLANYATFEKELEEYLAEIDTSKLVINKFHDPNWKQLKINSLGTVCSYKFEGTDNPSMVYQIRIEDHSNL
jgi:hypothetical protein